MDTPHTLLPHSKSDPSNSNSTEMLMIGLNVDYHVDVTNLVYRASRWYKLYNDLFYTCVCCDLYTFCKV